MAVAIPTFLCAPAQMNQDTYLYLARANHYLQAPHWQVQDALTVGPVLPAFVAIAKAAIQKLIGWSPEHDILIAKLLTLVCYCATAACMIIYNRRKGIETQVTAFVLLLTAFLFPPMQDIVSLNAELVCSPLFGVFLLVASAAPRRVVHYSVLVVIALLILYTKIQAVLLLGVAIWTGFDSKDRSKLVVYLAVGFLAVESVLFFVGGGWMPKMASLLWYIRAGNVDAEHAAIGVAFDYNQIYAFAAKHLSHVWWTVSASFTVFPFVLPMTIAAYFLRRPATRWATPAWWAVVSLATIFVPGRPYDHYLLFWLPFVILYGATAMRELDGLIPRFLLGSALVVTMSAVKFCSIAADPSPLAGMSFQAFGPPPVISNQAAKVAHQIKLEPRATLFVHGWDFRYYSYFNKYVIGPWIIEGAKHPSTYAAEVLQENPTVILDVVNHSGLVRDGRFTLAAHPLWSQAILPRYTRVFDENGLVVYVLSTEVQAAGKPPEVKN